MRIFPFTFNSCRSIFISILLLLSGQVFAQLDYPDVFPDFLRTGITGTARSAGAGGAFGSVGADLSCVDINPAGLGLYRSTDFCITPAIRLNNNEAAYLGSTTNSRKVGFYIPQGGFAVTKMFANPNSNQSLNEHPFRSITFALNFETQNLFSRAIQFNAESPQYSMMDYYAAIANSSFFNVAPSNLSVPELAIANAIGVLNFNTNTGVYSGGIPLPEYQQASVVNTGSVSKIHFAIGGNFLDKIYFGASIVLPILSYNTTQTMSETNLNDTATAFQNYNLSSTITERGIGITGTLGMIYRPASWMRLGLSWHLPSVYHMTENYYSGGTATFDTVINTVSEQSVYQQPFTYRLRTPMKGTASASFYLKEIGFLSVDYDFQNYGATRIFQSDYQGLFDTIVNTPTKQTFTFTHSVRAGLEAAVKVVRFRLGYSFTTSPYKSSKGDTLVNMYSGIAQTASAGIGIRLKNFYADFAYVFGFTKDAFNTNNSYAVFPLVTEQVNSTLVTHSMLLTIGYRFNSGDNSNKQRKRTTHATPPPLELDDQQRY